MLPSPSTPLLTSVMSPPLALTPLPKLFPALVSVMLALPASITLEPPTDRAPPLDRSVDVANVRSEPTLPPTLPMRLPLCPRITPPWVARLSAPSSEPPVCTALFAAMPIVSALMSPPSITFPEGPLSNATVPAWMLPSVIWIATGPLAPTPATATVSAVIVAALIATGAVLRMVRLPSPASMALAMMVPPVLMPVLERPGPISAFMLMLRALRTPVLLMPVPANVPAAVGKNVNCDIPEDDTSLVTLAAPAATRLMLPLAAEMMPMLDTAPPIRLMPPEAALRVPPLLLTTAPVPPPASSKVDATPLAFSSPGVPGDSVLASRPPTFTLAPALKVMPAGLIRNTWPMDVSSPLMRLAELPVTRLTAVACEPCSWLNWTVLAAPMLKLLQLISAARLVWSIVITLPLKLIDAEPDTMLPFCGRL